MPPGASADALRVLAARGVRAFGDGFVALVLPIYLVELGFSTLAIGAIVGSPALDVIECHCICYDALSDRIDKTIQVFCQRIV